MTTQDTFVAVLQEHAHRQGDRPAMTFVADLAQHPTGESLSYQELDLLALRPAALLQQRYPVGERVMLLFPAGLQFAVAMLGCLYAGLIAVPVPIPDRSAQSRQRCGQVIERGPCHCGVDSGVGRLDVAFELVPVPAGGQPERVTDQVDDAGLHHRQGPHVGHRLWQPFEPVTNEDIATVSSLVPPAADGTIRSGRSTCMFLQYALVLSTATETRHYDRDQPSPRSIWWLRLSR
jgi:hypothetical protein